MTLCAMDSMAPLAEALDAATTLARLYFAVGLNDRDGLG